jgi:hypothetical protein
VVGAGGGDAAEVAVLEAVAVAFEGDDVGVVDEAKARGFGDSRLLNMRKPVSDSEENSLEVAGSLMWL